ncbi:MAG: ATP-binding protein [Bacteroidota bacterium]
MNITEHNDIAQQIGTIFTRIQKEWAPQRQRRLGSYRKLILNFSEELRHDPELSDLKSHQYLLSLMRKWRTTLKEQIAAERRESSYRKSLHLIGQILQDLPEQALLRQGEHRFKVGSDNSLEIRLIKTVKRGVRGFKRMGVKVTNLYRKLIQKEPSVPEPWTHEVCPRYLAMHLVMESEEVWRNEVYHDWYALAQFLYELESWQDTWLLGREVSFTGTQRIYDRIMDPSKAVESLRALLDQQADKFQQVQQHVASSSKQQVEQWQELLLSRLEVAGTLEHRDSYDQASAAVIRKKREESVLNIEEQWIQLSNLLLDEMGLYHELLQYGYRVDQQTEQLLNKLENPLRNTWIAPVQATLDRVIEVYKQIRESDSPEQWEQIREELLSQINTTWIGAVEETSLAETFKELLHQYQVDIQLGIRSISENSRVFDKLNLDDPRPQFVTLELPLRDWATRYIKQQLLQPIHVLVDAWTEAEAQLIASGQEIREIIAVNIESAIEGEIEEQLTDPQGQSMLLDGLERALVKLEQVRGEVEYQRLRANYLLRGKSTETIWRMLEWIGQDELDEFKRADRTGQVKEVATDWKTKLMAVWARLTDRVSVWTRFATQKAKHWGKEVAPWLGIKLESETVGEQRKMDISAYLRETDEQIKQLPYVYRKIFSMEASTEDRFYVPIRDTISRFERAYQNWLAGQPTNAAVVGERGSGKTSLLNQVRQRYLADENCTRITIHQTLWQEEALVRHIAGAMELGTIDSANELIEQLHHRSDKTKNVVILEGIQNTYLRHINGYDAIHQLLLLISKTRESIFWIVSCSRYAWYFLSKAVSIDDYFSVTLQTDALNDEQVERLIMDRHKVSGYDLYFEVSDTIQNSRAFKKVMDDSSEVQAYLRKQYFEKLAEAAEGNGTIAMLFWLRSISKVEDTVLTISPIEITQLNSIDTLKPETIFALAALILHDALDARELAISQHISSHKAELILSRLSTQGLIQHANLAENKEFWAINPLIYRQALRTLRQRNVIHGYGGDRYEMFG